MDRLTETVPSAHQVDWVKDSSLAQGQLPGQQLLQDGRLADPAVLRQHPRVELARELLEIGLVAQLEGEFFEFLKAQFFNNFN